MPFKFRPKFGWGRRHRLLLGIIAIAAHLLYFRFTFQAGMWDAVMILVALGILNEIRIFLGVHYLLTGESLILVAWPFRWRFPLDKITRVRQGKGWWYIRGGESSLSKILTLSSKDLAFSSDYVVVQLWDGRTTRVSPSNKNSFISVLKERAQYAVFEGLDT